MPKRNRDGDEDDSQKSNNGTVTIKEEVVSPGGAAASAITTTTASASTKNMGDRTKDVEELKGMLRTSMDQQADVEAENEKYKAKVDELEETVKGMQDKLNIRCTHQLLARVARNHGELPTYPHPKLLDIVRQGKITPADLDWDSAPLGPVLDIQYVHLKKCSELVEVFKNGLSPQHKLEWNVDSNESIAIHVLSLGDELGQAITNENKDDFIILGATARFFSKPLAELIYDKEWPELTKQLWKEELPHHAQVCQLYVLTRTAHYRKLPKFIQAGLSTEPYDALVKKVHVPKADNPRKATECDIDLDRMVVVDVVTKVERELSFSWA